MFDDCTENNAQRLTDLADKAERLADALALREYNDDMKQDTIDLQLLTLQVDYPGRDEVNTVDVSEKGIKITGPGSFQRSTPDGSLERSLKNLNKCGHRLNVLKGGESNQVVIRIKNDLKASAQEIRAYAQKHAKISMAKPTPKWKTCKLACVKFVEANGKKFPGISELSRQTGYSRHVVRHAVKESKYLTESQKNSKKKTVREVPLAEGRLASTPQATEADPHVALEQKELVTMMADQAAEMESDQRQYKASKRRGLMKGVSQSKCDMS